MMKPLYLGSTALFGTGLLAFWLAAITADGDGSNGKGAAKTGMMASPEASGSSEKPRFALAQVRAHAKPSDCWMAIEGDVFDVSAYVPQHPAPPSVIAEWCGKEATRAFQTKDRGRPHSTHARQLLEQYRIGTLDGSAAPR